MIKLVRFLAPIGLASIAACSSGKKTVTVKVDAPGSGSAVPDAPGLCGISTTVPAIAAPAANIAYRTEDHVFAAKMPPVLGGDPVRAGEIFAFALLPAAPENTDMTNKPDSIQIVLFEQTINQGFPVPGTYVIGSLADTPPGSNQTNPFTDNPVPGDFQIEVDAFDGTDADPNSHWLAAAGSVTITSDTTAKFKGSFDGVTLIHFTGTGAAADAMTCQTMSGSFTFDAAPAKRTTLTGRDDAATSTDLLSQKQAYVAQHRGQWQRPTL